MDSQSRDAARSEALCWTIKTTACSTCTVSDGALCCFRANTSEKQKEQKQDVALSLTSGAAGTKEEPSSSVQVDP